jgi:signal transduction protein with GAF and PtsI domain
VLWFQKLFKEEYMQNIENNFTKLVDISTFLEQHANLDTCLTELVSMVANFLNVENCSIMLLKVEDDSVDFRLRVFAKNGYLPPNAFKEAEKINDGIAGHVAATCKALLVEDIGKSPFSSLARRPDNPNKSFMSVPIMIRNKIIGVLNLSNSKDGHCFNPHDLELASFMAMFVGKSTQVVQLQNLLDSRFSQMALIRESSNMGSNILTPISQDPAQLSKILAKSFYQEMTKVGLGRDHIINAATEILSLLSESLAKHAKRIKRT